MVFEVSGDDKKLVGTYAISHEVANGAPDCPVWKLVGKEFYVFKNGLDETLGIGTKQNLTDGFFLYKSKNWVHTLNFLINENSRLAFSEFNFTILFICYVQNDKFHPACLLIYLYKRVVALLIPHSLFIREFSVHILSVI